MYKDRNGKPIKKGTRVRMINCDKLATVADSPRPSSFFPHHVLMELKCDEPYYDDPITDKHMRVVSIDEVVSIE